MDCIFLYNLNFEYTLQRCANFFRCSWKALSKNDWCVFAIEGEKWKFADAYLVCVLFFALCLNGWINGRKTILWLDANELVWLVERVKRVQEWAGKKHKMNFAKRKKAHGTYILNGSEVFCNRNFELPVYGLFLLRLFSLEQFGLVDAHLQ